MIERPFYLKQLIDVRDNGFPKVITGLRRCSKSYLLTDIYPSYLRSVGVEEASIIYIPLDDDKSQALRDPLELGKHVLAKEGDEQTVSFVDVVLGLSREANIDLYVTGSNSKMLSSDIVTEFRDKATEIRRGPFRCFRTRRERSSWLRTRSPDRGRRRGSKSSTSRISSFPLAKGGKGGLAKTAKRLFAAMGL